MDGGDISSFVTNGEWDLIGNTHLLLEVLGNRCVPSHYIFSYLEPFLLYCLLPLYVVRIVRIIFN